MHIYIFAKFELVFFEAITVTTAVISVILFRCYSCAHTLTLNFPSVMRCDCVLAAIRRESNFLPSFLSSLGLVPSSSRFALGHSLVTNTCPVKMKFATIGLMLSSALAAFAAPISINNLLM